MKPFALDNVLKYRKQLLDSAATKLAQRQRELQAEQLLHSALQREYTNTHQKFSDLQHGGISVGDLVMYQERLQWLKTELKSAQAKVNSARQRVSQQRDIVVKRSRDTKVLERLKEKQNREYASYLEKKETLQLDEIAVLSYDRQQNLEE